jgi:NTP pyrophosphatase (non-canonical NTP hydrolase)
MDLNEYQTRARDTAVYQNIGKNPRYAMIGLCEEVGEIAGQLKRIERDDGDIITPERREKIKLECGDALWYLASLAAELGLTLNEIAEANLAKLADRRARKTLHGAGDAR